MPFVIEPEVAGGLGAGTELESSVHPPRVERLVYELEGWLGDDLLETFPCFVVTAALGAALEAAGLTGFSLDAATVVLGPEFALRPHTPVPVFRWLKVTGRAGVDDLWLHTDRRLAASDRAMAILRAGHIDHAHTEPLEQFR